MINALTLVSLGMLTSGGLEIVPLNEATPAAQDYRSDEPHPPVPTPEATVESTVLCPGGPHSGKQISLAKTVSIDKSADFDLEGLKLDKPFVVLREENRPAWVKESPQLKGDGVHFISVASDPWKTDFEANESLEKKLRSKVNDYINDQIGRTDAAQRIRVPQETLVGLVGERYTEDLQFSDSAIGAMKQVHARLAFTPAFRAEIAERWKEHVVNARLLRTGVGVVAVFALLMMAFGVLKRLGGR
jgi:hypothetical protein